MDSLDLAVLVQVRDVDARVPLDAGDAVVQTDRAQEVDRQRDVLRKLHEAQTCSLRNWTVYTQ